MTTVLFKKCLCTNFRRVLVISKRYLKRKIPIDRDHEYDVPVFQYPVGSSGDRRVYVWGLSEHGALGNKLQFKRNINNKRLPEYHHKPLRLTFAELHKVTDVACGYGFTIFAVDTKQKYKVFGSGINSDSQVGYHDPRKDHPLHILTSPAPIELPLHEGTKVIGVSAGRAHTAVLTDKQGAYLFGNNSYGQCGRRVIPDEQYGGSRTINHIGELDSTEITSIHCGQDHSLFITKQGTVYSCGWGADGQLGLGNFQSQSHPSVLCGEIFNERIIKVVGQGDCILALNDKGEVFGWGNNEYRQLTEVEDVQQICSPIQVATTKGLGKIVDIAAGGSFCAVVNEEGAVFVWGYGLLGLGPNVQKLSKPQQIPPTLFGKNMFMQQSKVTSLGSGLFHLAAMTNQGHLYMWGRNKGGCLGLGHINDQFFPLKVSVGAHVLKLAAGVDHTVILSKPFT